MSSINVPPGLEGLVFERLDSTRLRVILKAAERNALKTLLTWLPEGMDLGFFDRFYPSTSDPGAYVLVRRRGEVLVHQLGKHGWSTEWAKQSANLLAAWILINVEPSSPYGQPLRELTIQEVLSAP